jgi:hypothetical protein
MGSGTISATSNLVWLDYTVIEMPLDVGEGRAHLMDDDNCAIIILQMTKYIRDEVTA